MKSLNTQEKLYYDLLIQSYIEMPSFGKNVEEKLIIASQDLEHLNPYYTLSPIYDLTKIFYNISSA